MTSAITTLLLPGLGNSGTDHWQTHWERSNANMQRLIQDEWDSPDRHDWVARLNQEVVRRETPVVLAAHSSACAMVAHWSQIASPRHLSVVRGALLVAPSDPDGPNYPAGAVNFGPMPLRRLKFPTIVVASTDDIYVSPRRAQQYATAWGSRFVLLEGAGHINSASGLGSWPAGLSLLKSLHQGIADA